MYARVNRFQENPETLDESERIAEQEVIRGTGQSLAITFWESEEAMRASESAADGIRSELRDRTGAEIRAVERYEVALRVGV